MTIPGIRGSLTIQNRSKFKKRRLSGYDEQSLSHTKRECKVVEGHLMPDHVHILLFIPSKFNFSSLSCVDVFFSVHSVEFGLKGCRHFLAPLLALVTARYRQQYRFLQFIQGEAAVGHGVEVFLA